MVIAVPLSYLDRFRAQLLRSTLAIPSLRAAFISRPTRLFIFYLGSLVLGLSLSLFFPLFVLAVGPILYGVPHLFASARYVPRILGQEKRLNPRTAISLLLALSALVGILRIFTDLGLLSLSFIETDSFWPECLGLFLTFGFFVFLYREKNTKILAGSLVLILFSFLSWQAPLTTNAALLLVHNLVAFLFWVRACRTKGEKQIAGVATLLFTCLSCSILWGYFDGVQNLLAPQNFLNWANLDMQSFGFYLAPWSLNPEVGRRVVIAYAFGQSLHYFVWMKAIPDQSHTNPVPTKFVQSYTLLEKDFGKKMALGAVLVTAVGLCTWMLLSYSQARIIYFALASFHSYFELAGLMLFI